MWLPRWLGESYCKLHAEFGTREFEFEDALRVLQQSDERLRVILSWLKRSGFLDVLARKNRKRIYRLADPAEVALVLGKGIDIRKVPEPARPVLRSYLKELFGRYGERVISIVLYGSFSVGKYERESDIDLLLVIKDYRRDEPLAFPATEELVYRQWELEKRYHNVQPYPLNREQARYHRPIYLDMTVDGIILYDKDGFIEKVFSEIRRRLAELGARRYELPDGSQYWILKPVIKEGEVVEI